MSNPMRFGWKKQKPDTSDVPFSTLKMKLGPQPALPAKVDLRPRFPVTPYDQGDLGSCTANATVGAAEFLTYQHRKMWIEQSRLFLYYDTRVLEGTVNEDAGAELRDVIKVAARDGLCGEWAWRYDVSKFTIKPPPYAFKNAMTHLFNKYYAIQDAARGHDVQVALAAGFPVIMGFNVYDSFQSDVVAKTGIVPIPGRYDQPIGGHAVLIMGYDTAKRWYIVRNSWGPGWGDKGFFYAPYAYFNDPKQASDFWVLQSEVGL